MDELTEIADSHRRRLVYLVVVLAFVLVVPDPANVPALRAPGGEEWKSTFVAMSFVSGVVLDREPDTLAWILLATLLFISGVGLL